PLQGKVELTLNGEPLFVQGSIDDIAEGNAYALHSNPVYTGDSVELTLSVNDMRGQSELTALVSFQGASEQVVIHAPGDYSVQLPGIDQVGFPRATAAIAAGSGSQIAGLSTAVE